jgi:hypothetical protein
MQALAREAKVFGAQSHHDRDFMVNAHRVMRGKIVLRLF